LYSIVGALYPFISPVINPFIQSRVARRGLATLSSIYVLYLVYTAGKRFRHRKHLDQKRHQRQKEVNEAFQRLQERVEGLDDESITNLSIFELRQKLSKGELKAVDVLEAFWAKALKVHNLTNCLVEPIFEAEDAAKAYDNGRKGGMLAGIPVSIKDDIAIKDYTSTTGVSVRLGELSKEDSALVKILRKQGAVLHVKTNEPQLGLSIEPGNPIYGTVRNPHNLKRNPGASSSGEGALIGGGGGVLGFGSDIGGSIRIPANNCGCTGFKPTSERVSHLGMDMLMLEESAVPATWGPLARDVDTVVLAMQAIWDGSMHEFDALSPPLKFQKEMYQEKKPLKIGYYYQGGYFNPTPVACRAVDMAVAELKRQGHTVVEWFPPGCDVVDELEFKVLLQDGGQEVLQVLEGDIFDETLKPTIVPAKFPWIVKTLMIYLMKLLGTKKDVAIVEAYKGLSGGLEVMKLNKEVKDFTYNVIREWEKADLDAVICPTYPFPPLPLGQTELSTRGVSYTMMYNVLNFPAGVVRMTKQTKQDIEALKDFEIKDKFHAKVKEFTEEGEGLPQGVMVGALRWQDEKCLRVMKAVERAADYTVV